MSIDEIRAMKLAVLVYLRQDLQPLQASLA